MCSHVDMHWAAATAAAAAAAAAAAVGKARANRCDSNMLTYEADWGVIRAPAWTVQIPFILKQEQHPFMSDFEQHAGIVDTGVRMTHHMPFYQPLWDFFWDETFGFVFAAPGPSRKR